LFLLTSFPATIYIAPYWYCDFFFRFVTTIAQKQGIIAGHNVKGDVYILDTGTTILIVDDRIKLCESLACIMEERGYRTITATTGAAAVELFTRHGADAVLLDLMLGDEDGLSVLPLLLNLKPGVPVIVITGYGTVETAVRAIRTGAFDYIQKPIRTEKLLKVIENALRLSALEKENNALKGFGGDGQLVTESGVMKDLLANVRRLSTSNLPILIQGESGTGKDLLADFIHRNSSRASRAMEKINCAAFPDSLLDNELFGHEKGSFTGANSLFQGLFERSHEGTLFLDEIGDMPVSIQTKILRAIQNKEIRRIGGSLTIHADIRFIAATNQDLEALVAAGSFRSDLLYRLNSATVFIPPLRERIEDIKPLALRFLFDTARENHLPAKSFVEDVIPRLGMYSWPGNVRELKSAVEYAFAVSASDSICLKDLPWSVREDKQESKIMSRLENAERELVESALKEEKFNKKKAAACLGMSRATLYNKMKKYGITTS